MKFKIRESLSGESKTPKERKLTTEERGKFIPEADLGPELTKDNCCPELWKEMGGDYDDIKDEDLPF